MSRGFLYHRILIGSWLVFGLSMLGDVKAATEDQRAQFKEAWTAAASGDHATFRQYRQGLSTYTLYPYFQYEDYRSRRAHVDVSEMAVFLEEHEDWAFAAGLRSAWLRSLGETRQWQALIDHAGGKMDVETRCHLARARIELDQTDGLMGEVQDLWRVGKSQPKVCNAAFDWMRQRRGISRELAWERIRLAMQAGNPRLTLYLERYVPTAEREWVRRWQDLSRSGYRQLERAGTWPDKQVPRMIASVSLRRLARRDPARAAELFWRLDSHFTWLAEERAQILRDIALQAAVALDPIALDLVPRIASEFRDGQLQEWWARSAIAARNWGTLADIVKQMPDELAADGRWRYWHAHALSQLGQRDESLRLLSDLSIESTFYGFRAADALDRPYTICPKEPEVDSTEVARLRKDGRFSRALELRAIGLGDWAVSEWVLATAALAPDRLRTAAALAWEQEWYDRVIFALGDSGDRRYYEWRFPLVWESEVFRQSSRQRLEPSWVMAVMRSESALAENARSSAGALGLMQVTPATARRLSQDYGISYSSQQVLREAETNITYGTTFMRELLDRFDQNPVLVAGAYNAGPGAVERWLRTRPTDDISAWLEIIPYFETRDYIPRVLAFTAIYDWRLGRSVTRLDSRMQPLDSGTMQPRRTTEVVCLASG